MKTKFTSLGFRYFAFTLLFAYLSLNLSAQTSHKVSVSSYMYSPKVLTITVGDTVIWTNTSGTHNVDGKTSAYPNNPVSFGNDLGAGWTYKFVFSTVGTYDYKCDPHAALGMVGQIVVNAKVATLSPIIAVSAEKILLYPNPANEYIQLIVPSDYEAINLVKVYTIAGSTVDIKAFSENTESYLYDISQLKNGIYFMEISTGNQRNVLKFIKQ